MQNKYEAPELTLIGEAEEVVMGIGNFGDDCPFQTVPEFEFAQD